MPVWDRLNLNIYYQRKLEDPSYKVQYPPEYNFYPKQTFLRKIWLEDNKLVSKGSDPWGMDSLGAVLQVLDDGNIDKNDLCSVLKAFNHQRYSIAKKNGTLRQNKGFEFGRARRKFLGTHFADLTNFQYGSAYPLFQQVRSSLRFVHLNEAGFRDSYKSVVTFRCPRDALLGEIGLVMQFERKRVPDPRHTIFPNELIIYDLVHFSHDKISHALDLCGKVYSHIMSKSYTDAIVLMRDLGRIHRWLAIICYAERGSSAIALWTVQMMALAKGYPLFNPTAAFDHDIDFSAYLLSEAEYLENFTTLACAPNFLTTPARSTFIRELYTACKGISKKNDRHALKDKIVKYCEQNENVDYEKLLDWIREDIKIFKPKFHWTSLQFWTLPKTNDVSKALAKVIVESRQITHQYFPL